MKYVFLFLILFIFILIALCLYALSSAVSPKQFLTSGIVQFSSNGMAFPFRNRLTVITYNMGYASGEKNNRAVRLTKEEVLQNLDTMVEKLRFLDADIYFLQEVDFQSARTFEINQMEYLARKLGMPYGVYVITWNKRYLPWPYWPPKVHFGRMVSGQAVLSRFPIEAQELHGFEKPQSNPFWYNWFYLDRVAQKVVINVGERKLHLWNIHFEAFDSNARQQQAERLADLVLQERAVHKQPLQIVAGDFNSVSFSRRNVFTEDKGEALRLLLQKTRLQNAEGEVADYSIPSWDPDRKIDHILYDPNFFLMQRWGIQKFVASDHLPVWARFTLNTNNPFKN